MATQLPSNLYSAEAGVFNSTPHTQFITGLMARQAAKDEALEKYYQNMNKSLNPAGVRTQDVDGFMQRTGELQSFWQQNKNAILNPKLDNGKAQTEYHSRFKDTLGYVNSSKQEAEKIKPFSTLLADPEKRKRVTDKMMVDVQLHDLPLDDPMRLSFDATKIDFNPKELSLTEWQNYWKGVGHGIAPDKNEISAVPDPKDRFSMIETTTAKYSPEKLKTIGDAARNDYLSSDQLQQSFAKMQQTPEEFDRYNTIYKSVYGKEIMDGDDLFAAVALSKKVEPTSTSKRTPNWGERFKAQEGKDRRMVIFREGVKDGDGGEETNIRDVYSEIITKWKNSKAKGFDGLSTNSLSATAQSILVKYGRELTGDNDLGQGDIYIGETKDGALGVFRKRKGKNNKPRTDDLIITTIDFSDANLKGVNTTVRERQEVLKKEENKKNTPAASKWDKYKSN